MIVTVIRGENMDDWRGLSKEEWMKRAIAAEQRAEAAEAQLRYVSENLSVYLMTQDPICGERLRKWIAEYTRR